jgi:hypothetical protein
MFLRGCRTRGPKLSIALALTKLGSSSAPNARPPRPRRILQDRLRGRCVTGLRCGSGRVRPWRSVGAAHRSIVATVSFWDRQVEELRAGLAALLDGDRTAWDAHVGLPASPTPPIAPGMPTAGRGDEAVTRAGQTVPAQWSGRSADAVDELRESIRRVHSARTEADRRLGDAVTAIHAAAQHVHARLHGIREQVDNGIGALQSTMDTPAGHQQMAEFLAAKTRDVQVVIDQAREASTVHMAGLGEAQARYATACR